MGYQLIELQMANKSKNPYNLNDKQVRFCREYVIDNNATQASIRAGYSKKTAHAIGEKLLRKVEVQSFINDLKQDLEKSTQISAQKVLLELSKIAFSNLGDYIYISDNEIMLKDWSKLTREQTAAVESVRKTRDGYQIKLYNKTNSLELLGNHFNLFGNEQGQLSDNEIEKLRQMIYAEMQDNI